MSDIIKQVQLGNVIYDIAVESGKIDGFDPSIYALLEDFGWLEQEVENLRDDMGQIIKRGTENAMNDGVFDIQPIETNVSNNQEEIELLKKDADQVSQDIILLKALTTELGIRIENVKSYVDENNNSNLEFSDGNGIYKIRITESGIHLMEDASIPAQLSRKMLIIEKAMIKDEQQFGDDEVDNGVWIWKRRPSGNLGLSWKGVE